MLNTQFLTDSKDDLQRAAHLLQSGGTVAVPTETVYGLAANARDPEAVAKIFSAKKRPSNHPLIVHIHSIEQLHQLCTQVPEQAYILAKAFWPGPLTMILPKHDKSLDAVTGGLDSIGVRMPAHSLLRELLREGDLVVAAPSANPHKQLSPTTAQQVFNELKGKINAVVDGGACEVGLESTIIDLSKVIENESPRVLRAGPITANQLAEALQQEVISYRAHQQQVPGNIKQHYQPNSPLSVMTTEALCLATQQWPLDTACVFYSDTLANQFGQQALESEKLKQLSEHKSSYAKALYSALYELDQLGAQRIWVEQPPQTEEWEDVNDRLKRASA